MAKLRTKSRPGIRADAESLSLALQYLELQMSLGESSLRMLDIKRSSKPATARGSSTCCQKGDSRAALAAKSLRSVNHGVFLLETLLRETRQFSGRGDEQLQRFLRELPSRIESLQKRTAAVGDRYVRTGLLTDNGFWPTFPPSPDPFCDWFCEIINDWKCRLNPNCTLTPCDLFC